MPPIAPPPPPWFLEFWEDNCHRLPMMLRGDTTMNLAWALFELLLSHVGRYARTPDGMKQVIAFARITAIMQGAQGVLDAPDPSPEQVEEALRKLLDKAKQVKP